MRRKHIHKENSGMIKRAAHSRLARYALLFAGYCLLVSFLLVLHAEAAEPIGKFSSVEGTVEVLRGGALPAIPVKAGDPVFAKDVVRTKSNSKAELAFADGNIVKIAQRSRVDISEYTADKGIITLPRGKVEAVVQKKGPARAALSGEGRRFEVHTPTAIAGVRGTDFFVFHNLNVTGVLVKEGTVYAYNPNFPKDVVNVPAGSITTISEKSPPKPPRPATAGEMKAHEKDVPADKPKGKAEGESGNKQAQGDDQSKDQKGRAKEGESGDKQAKGDDKPGEGGGKGAASEGGHAPAESGGTAPLGGLGDTPPASMPEVLTANVARDSVSVATGSTGPVIPTVPITDRPSVSCTPPYDTPGCEAQRKQYLEEQRQAALAAAAAAQAAAAQGEGKAFLLATAFTRTVQKNPSYTSADDGLISGDLKIDAAPWGGASSTMGFDGYYFPKTNTNPAWVSSIVYSYNDKDTIKPYTTYDGGAFYGYAGGKLVGSNSEGKLYALYIDPKGNAGYLLGGLSGTTAAVPNTTLFTLTMTGSVKSVEMNPTTGLLPNGLMLAALMNTKDETAGTTNSFYLNGTQVFSASNPYDYSQKRTSINSPADWGIWYAKNSGDYTGFAMTNTWNWEIEYYPAPPADYTKYIFQRTDGALWSSNSIYGTTRGFYADVTNNPTTGIAIGETFGTFNPSDHTFQAVQTGVWMDTTKFLAMAADPTGRAKLQQLNIPSVEVGRTNLSGTYTGMGMMSVSMNNVIFFAPSSGAKPLIWATGSVSGGYDSAYGYAGTNVNLSGGGMSATFTPKKWDTATGKWLATVTNGSAPVGTLSGYSGSNVSFQGAAAGTINTVSHTISGTAAGIAK